jgi:hypothetical protein
MEHIYKSIEIRDYLYSFFPLPDLAIELIINNLKLAVDLNGYTNEMLKLYINQHKIVDLNKYLRKTYGKYRSNLSLLKRYQLIKVIQHFNIPVSLKPYKIDIIDKYLNDNGIKYENKNIYVNDKLYIVNNIITLGRITIDITYDNYIVKLGDLCYRNNKIEYKTIIFLYCYYNIIENNNIEMDVHKNKILNKIIHHNYI